MGGWVVCGVCVEGGGREEGGGRGEMDASMPNASCATLHPTRAKTYAE